MVIVDCWPAGIDVVRVHVTVCPAVLHANPLFPVAVPGVSRLSNVSVTTVFVPVGVAALPVFVTTIVAVLAPPVFGSVFGLNDLVIVVATLPPTVSVALAVAVSAPLVTVAEFGIEALV